MDSTTKMPKIFVEMTNKAFKLPKRATEGSSGYDLYSSDNLMLAAGARVLVPTGLKMVIPKGFEGLIRSRSGLALKHGIAVLNSPGTIDSDYRGEIKVILINTSKETFEIQKGMRIAQMVFATHETPTLEIINSVDEYNTERKDGGFGSTGIQIVNK